MGKLINFIKENKLALISAFVLFFIPFFWLRPGEVDYGGDSSRLYFLSPEAWLKNIALYYVNPLVSMGGEMPNFLLVPFLAFLSVIKTFAFGKGWIENRIFNGLLLSGGFLSVNFIVKELFISLKVKKDKDELISIFSGLFFILSPLIIYTWERALYSTHQSFVYPLAFFLFLKYINSKKWVYLILAAFEAWLFSVNFSFATFPWLAAFIIFSSLFFLLYSLFFKKIKIFIKGIFILITLIFLLNSFDYLPQVYNMANSSSTNYQTVFSKEIQENQGLAYYLSIQPYMRVVYTLANQPQYTIAVGYGDPQLSNILFFGIKFLPLFFVYPLIFSFGLIIKGKYQNENFIKTYNLIAVIFLTILFFMTACITDIGQAFYQSLFSLPGFSMFRSFYGKFSMVYLFYYAIFLAFSLKIILGNINSLAKKIPIIFLILLVLFNGWPLISGSIVNGILWQSKKVGFSSEIDSEYLQFLEGVKEEKKDAKIFSLPLIFENYQILQGKFGGAYFGPSTIPIFTRKNSFNGILGFFDYWTPIKELIVKKDYDKLNYVLPLLDIGYIFHNKDNFIYDNFPYFPYDAWFRQQFPDQISLKQFINNLGYKEIYISDNYSLYENNEKDYLPHFYIPKEIVYTAGGVEFLPKILEINDLDRRTALYFKSQELDLNKELYNNFQGKIFIPGENDDEWNLTREFLEPGIDINYPTVKEKSLFEWWPTVIYEKYNTWIVRKYRISYLDKKLFYANKRVNEVTSYKVNEKTLLLFYKSDITDIIKIISTIEDEKVRKQQSLKLKNNLLDNLSRLNLNNPKNLESWIGFIIDSVIRINEMSPKVKIDKKEYIGNFSVNDEYEILLKENNPIENFGSLDKIKDFSIDIDGSKIVCNYPLGYLKEGWISCSKVKIESGIKRIIINFGSTVNLLENKIWRVSNDEIFKKELVDDGEMLKLFDWSERNNIFVSEVILPRSGSWYKLVLKDKLLHPLKLSFIEENQGVVGEKTENTKSESDKYKVIQSYVIDKYDETFETFFKTVTTSERKIIAEIELKEDEKINEEDLNRELEKISLNKVLDFDLVFRGSSQKNEINTDVITEAEIPKISFSKINPVLYKIKVENANKPFLLVFNESFHKGWKIFRQTTLLENKFAKFLFVFLKNIPQIGSLSEEYEENILQDISHFNGKIVEQHNGISFLNKLTFSNIGKKSISENSHFKVNGYANSWYIDPKDTGDQKDFELVVEFVPQRLFFFGLTISIFSLAILIVVLLVKIIKNKFFNKEEINRNND